MESYPAARHVALIEKCVMTGIGIRHLWSKCCLPHIHVHVFRSPEAFYQQANRHRYGSVIYSIAEMRESRQESIFFLTRLMQSHPGIQRLVLARDNSEANLIAHLAPQSVQGIVCKSEPLDVLKVQLQALLVARTPVSALRGTPPELSPTEWAILNYMSEGLSVPQIAVQMARNAKTIRTHKFNAMSKLGVNSDTGLLYAADILAYLPANDRRIVPRWT